MRIGLQNTDWSFVGAKLSIASDDEQIAFFKAFVKECRSWETSHQAEMQLANINSGLNDDEKELLSMLGYKEDME